MSQIFGVFWRCIQPITPRRNQFRALLIHFVDFWGIHLTKGQCSWFLLLYSSVYFPSIISFSTLFFSCRCSEAEHTPLSRASFEQLIRGRAVLWWKLVKHHPWYPSFNASCTPAPIMTPTPRHCQSPLGWGVELPHWNTASEVINCHALWE